MALNWIPCGGVFNCPILEKEIIEVENQLANPSIWQNNEAFKPLLKKQSLIKDKLSRITDCQNSFDELTQLFELAAEESEASVIQDVVISLAGLKTKLDQFELDLLLSDELDGNNAIVSIHAGSGGLEAKEWVRMLMRMYVRWADAHDFKSESIHIQPAEENSSRCLESVTLQINGKLAYGMLKNESGVHRLIRNSPFDSSGRRHTSFAAVEVLPDIENEITVEVKENEIECQTMRSSGPGGQNSNKVESAIRIIHISTGIAIRCQSSRSQLENRKMAMKLLKTKLYDLEVKKRQEEENSRLGTQQQIAFGSQIRTYVLEPFQMVTDHRTDQKKTNATDILDGDIDSLIEESLYANKNMLKM